jgi:predicted DNA-binding WGR domain protein
VNQREIFADKKIPDKSLEYNDEAEESRAYKIVAYPNLVLSVNYGRHGFIK